VTGSGWKVRMLQVSMADLLPKFGKSRRYATWAF
jgi:hypothetical protein